VLGLDRPDAASIAARWQASGGTTRAVIGACYDGPFGVDLAKGGPHGLVDYKGGSAFKDCAHLPHGDRPGTPGTASSS
jgi:S-DNA-T family DNA segregation ATPase FtsK/SpoIIIE